MKVQFLQLIILLLVNSVYANDCIQTSAAFDIGSGTTKMKVAKVDICKHKILKILLESHRSVGYKQDLKESTKNLLSEKILTIGSIKLNELKNEAKKYRPTSFIAVATSAFRTASNGVQAAKILSKNTEIKVNIISQVKEAEIGFVGAYDFSKDNLAKLLVWDIGGGSMQISSTADLKKFDVYEGKLASVSFKNYIIEKIQFKNPKKIKSPNPISNENYLSAIDYVKKYSLKTIPKSIQKKLRNKELKIIGIGGVHFFSIASKVNNKEFYTLEMVKKRIKESLNKTDSELGGGEYIETDISNLILVAGIMEEFGINMVITKKVNLANGVLKLPSIVNE